MSQEVLMLIKKLHLKYKVTYEDDPTYVKKEIVEIENEDSVVNAAKRLGEIGDKQVIEHLIQAARQEKVTMRVRQSCFEAVISIIGIQDVSYLIEILPQEFARKYMIALGNKFEHTQQFIQSLIYALDKRNDVLSLCLDLLVNWEIKESTGVITKLLGVNNSETLRLEAAMALTQLDYDYPYGKYYLFATLHTDHPEYQFFPKIAEFLGKYGKSDALLHLRFAVDIVIRDKNLNWVEPSEHERGNLMTTLGWQGMVHYLEDGRSKSERVQQALSALREADRLIREREEIQELPDQPEYIAWESCLIATQITSWGLRVKFVAQATGPQGQKYIASESKASFKYRIFNGGNDGYEGIRRELIKKLDEGGWTLAEGKYWRKFRFIRRVKFWPTTLKDVGLAEPSLGIPGNI